MSKAFVQALIVLGFFASCKTVNRQESRPQSQNLLPLTGDLIVYGSYVGETVPTSTGSFTPLNLNRTASVQFLGLSGMRVGKFLGPDINKGVIRCSHPSGPCSFFIHHRQLVPANPRSGDAETFYSLQLDIKENDGFLNVHIRGDNTAVMKLSVLLAPLKDQQPPAGEMPIELEKEFDPNFQSAIRCRFVSMVAKATEDTGCFFKINKSGEILAD